MREHLRTVSAFADPIELAKADRDRSWHEPRLEGVVRNGRFRIWLSVLSSGRAREIRGSFTGVLQGRISDSNGTTVVSGLARPSLVGMMQIGFLIFVIANPYFPFQNAPASMQVSLYALAIIALGGIIAASLVRPLIALRKILATI